MKFEVVFLDDPKYYICLEYFLNDSLHREDGPACYITHDNILGKSYIGYYHYGRPHRLAGPARQWADKSKEYWYNDKLIKCSSDQEFERIVKLLHFQ